MDGQCHLKSSLKQCRPSGEKKHAPELVFRSPRRLVAAPRHAPQSRRPSAAARRTLLALALGTCFLSTHGANAATTYTGTFPGGSTTNFSAAGLPSGGSGTNDSLIFTTSGTRGDGDGRHRRRSECYDPDLQ